MTQEYQALDSLQQTTDQQLGDMMRKFLSFMKQHPEIYNDFQTFCGENKN